MFDKKKTSQYIILLVVMASVFGLGFYVGKNQVVCRAFKPETMDFSLFWDAYNKLHEKFISKEKIDDQTEGLWIMCR